MENVLKCDVALSSSMLSRTDLKLKDIGFHAMGGWHQVGKGSLNKSATVQGRTPGVLVWAYTGLTQP